MDAFRTPMHSRYCRTFALALALFCVNGSFADKLPSGLGRLNPAGLPVDWIYEGTAFQVLRSADAAGSSVPVYRLRHPLYGYFLTASTAEVSQAGTNGFVREGVAFYTPKVGRLTVHRFRNPGNGTYFYALPGDANVDPRLTDEGVAFYAYRPSSFEGADEPPSLNRTPIIDVARYRNASSGHYLFTAGKESPYVVGAFYFGSFSDSAHGIIDGVARVHKRRNDWWGGVSDFFGGEPGIPADRRGWSGDWSYLKPAIGYYDQKSVTTLEKHIRQAADAGLTFFSFYWYWSRKENGERFPEALRSFLQARNSEQMKFNLSLFAHPWDEDMRIDASNAAEVANRIVTYFEKPNYLRLPDGRPVIMIGDFRNFSMSAGSSCADTRCRVKALENFIVLLKQASFRRIGTKPFVQVQAAAAGWDSVRETDGVSCVMPPMRLEGATPYPQFAASTFSPIARKGKPVSPCMLQNFDERPRQDILITDRKKVRYLVGKTDALFRHNLLVTKEFSDTTYASGRDPASRIVYLYAWNEWHEGGILEPNVATDAQDLNIVTDVFQLPRSSSRCLDHDAC